MPQVQGRRQGHSGPKDPFLGALTDIIFAAVNGTSNDSRRLLSKGSRAGALRLWSRLPRTALFTATKDASVSEQTPEAFLAPDLSFYVP